MRKEIDHRSQNRLEVLVFAWTYVGIGLGVGLLHYNRVIDLASALILASVLVMLVSFLLPHSVDPMVTTIIEGDEELEGFLLSARISLTPTIGGSGVGPPLYMIEIRIRFPNSLSPRALAYSKRKSITFFGGETHHIWVDDAHPHRDALHLSLQALSKGSGISGRPGEIKVTGGGLIYTEGRYVYPEGPVQGRISHVKRSLIRLADIATRGTSSS